MKLSNLAGLLILSLFVIGRVCQANALSIASSDSTTAAATNARRLLQTVPCDDNCNSCDNNRCVKCDDGYTLRADGSCVRTGGGGGGSPPCDDNCNSCDNNVCQKCDDGYQLCQAGCCRGTGGGGSPPCDDNCNSCDNNVCKKCDDGFQLCQAGCCRGTGGGGSPPCDDNCNSCDNNVCKKCDDGFQLCQAGCCRTGGRVFSFQQNQTRILRLGSTSNRIRRITILPAGAATGRILTGGVRYRLTARRSCRLTVLFANGSRQVVQIRVVVNDDDDGDDDK